MISAIKNYKKIFSSNGGSGNGLSYKGNWDADSNSPELVSSVGNPGEYYIVSVAGNTNLNGITDWGIGDWVIFEGGIWQKIDNSETGDKNYVHTQATTSDSWTVNHNLDKRCSVQVVGDDFKEVVADITWINNNTVQVDFNTATTGYVYCN
jgi:hypothetical protein